MKRVWIALILFAVFLQPHVLTCQETLGLKISGFVRDAENYRPLDAVSVDVVGDQGAAPATTDSNGQFYLQLAPNVKLGQMVRVRFTKQGYVTLTEYIPVAPESVKPFSLRRSDLGSDSSRVSGKNVLPKKEDLYAIGALSVLGWQVQPGEGDRLQFSDIYKHISIRQSAPYFCALERPFNLNIVGAQSLDGLHLLGRARHFVRFDLNSAEVSDLSEVAGLHNIQTFVMGQTTGRISDLGPLKDLTNLRELGLDSGAIRDLTPIQNLVGLRTLSLGGTHVSDLSPLRKFQELRSLNWGVPL